MNAPFPGTRQEGPPTPKEAIAIQERLKDSVILADQLPPVRCAAGVDAALDAGGKTILAAAALLQLPELAFCESSVFRMAADFPYIPGLLSFREAPAILGALERLPMPPDLILCDGQGLAHPRRFGIACHIGVLTGLPAIGVAKTRLTGEHQEPAEEKGSLAPLTDRGEVVGMVLRSRTGVKPVFVSPGHRISLETSVSLVMQCLGRFRLPEPLRRAHRLASEMKSAG